MHNEGPRTLADAVRSAQRHPAVQNSGNLEGAEAAPVMGVAEDEEGYEAASYEPTRRPQGIDQKQQAKSPKPV